MNAAVPLYEICLAPKPTGEWCEHFHSQLLKVTRSESEIRDQIDAVALLAARAFLNTGEFYIPDRVINNLFGYVVTYNYIPELMLNIYLAFDAGEVGPHDVQVPTYEAITRPKLLDLMKGV
jgi:hypothetical protein